MAKKKNNFYAVKKGRQTGIFKTWAECSAQVKGFQGATYQGFVTREDAEAYMKGTTVTDEMLLTLGDDTVIAYVDGSYCDTQKKYGCGVVLLHPNGHKEELSFNGEHPLGVEMRNVTGEIRASAEAIRRADQLGFKRVIIHHDYEGVAKWCLGEWKAKNELTQWYRDYYKNMKSYIDIQFKWVKGHSGDKYNEEADILAKKSLGLI